MKENGAVDTIYVTSDSWRPLPTDQVTQSQMCSGAAGTLKADGG